MDGQGRVLGGVTVEPELIKIYLFSRLTDLPYHLLMLGFYQKFRDFSDSFRQAL
jgi:hypothetical protein